jgi:hypothetical protein
MSDIPEASRRAWRRKWYNIMHGIYFFQWGLRDDALREKLFELEKKMVAEGKESLPDEINYYSHIHKRWIRFRVRRGE